MVNISVPIGKGTGKTLTELKFPDIPRAKPDIKFSEKTANSDLEFIKLLADQGRLVFSTNNTATTTTAFAEIIPLNGETFYFFNSNWSVTTTSGGATGTLEIRNDGVSRESILIPTSSQGITHGVWGLRFDSLVGDGVKQFDAFLTESVNPLTANCSISGYILPSETLSSRGTG